MCGRIIALTGHVVMGFCCCWSLGAELSWRTSINYVQYRWFSSPTFHDSEWVDTDLVLFGPRINFEPIVTVHLAIHCSIGYLYYH